MSIFSNCQRYFFACGLIFVSSFSHATLFQGIQTIVASPSVLTATDQFADTTADFGVACLEVNGVSDFAPITPLGGIQSDLSGNLVYLAVNDNATTTRMIRFDKPAISFNVDGLVESAAAGSNAWPYMTAANLTPSANNPTDHSNSAFLGMTIDGNSNDLYAAVQGPSGIGLMRLSAGVAAVGSVIEFAAPTTVTPLSPYAPGFASVLMGGESVAHFQQSGATDVFFFTDGTVADFCLGWAVQDLSFRRTGLTATTFSNDFGTPDTNFQSDEVRIHANILAGDYSLVDPTIHSDIAYVSVAQRMVFCTGRPSPNGLFVVDDLNDNTEIGSGSNPDTPQVSAVLTSLNPTALSNVFAGTGFNASQDILLAHYDTGNDQSRIIRVSFNASGNVSGTQVLNLTTPADWLPGRVSELTMDSDGNIYAVAGADGVVYVIAANETPDVPTPTPVPNFNCFETQSLVFGAPPDFTPSSLATYARNTRFQRDVITELELIDQGDLDLFLPRASDDNRRFFYVNRPITISSLDKLTLTNGDWLIFRSDGALRAFLEIKGSLKTDVIQPEKVRADYNPTFDDPNENEVRFTSVAGFISWLKSQGVANFAALNWAAPPADDAALEFQAHAQARFNGIPADPDALAAQINSTLPRTGRWAGLLFNDPDVGSGASTASEIRYSRIEFAEVGIYVQDRQGNQTNVRDENAVRIIGNEIERNLIGISIDACSPLVASNRIRFSDQDIVAFDGRNFGGNTPRSTACGLSASQRFPVGSSGVGVYITKRKLSSVPTDPLFTLNTITGNQRSGLEVQQPGVPNLQGTVFGTASSLNRPKPLFGRIVQPIAQAHEYFDSGLNVFLDNGSFEIEYYLRETVNDFGAANLTDISDMAAQSNIWGTADLDAIGARIRDGKDIGDLGEVILTSPIALRPSSVEDSVRLYE